MFVYLCVIRLIGDICFSDLKGKSKKVKPKYQNEGSRLSDKPKSREKCFLSSFTFLILYSLFSSVQFSHSIVSNSLRPHGLQHTRPPCPSPALLQLMSIELVMPSNHLILCHPLLFLPSIFPSIRVFSNESVLPIRWPKYWSFSFSISPSNEYSGLISFRMDWLYLFAVQGTLKSLQHHSSKASPCTPFISSQVFPLLILISFSDPFNHA